MHPYKNIFSQTGMGLCHARFYLNRYSSRSVRALAVKGAEYSLLYSVVREFSLTTLLTKNLESQAAAPVEAAGRHVSAHWYKFD